MPAASLTTSSRSSRVFRSLEAHVVPHLVQVAAGTEGIVSSVAAPHDVVERGQTVAIFERLWPTDGHGQHVAVTAPIPGVVMRCSAKAGDYDVLVVARFAAETVAGLRRGDRAAVFLAAGAREPLSATIVSVVEAPAAGASEGAHASRSAAVVLSIPQAPVEALWPASAAYIEVRS